MNRPVLDFRFLYSFRHRAALPGLGVALALWFSQPAAASVPDLTAGGVPNDNDQWNLGPTGMTGWCYRNGINTTNARQFLVRSVASGSPAAGILAVDDVILGASGTGAAPVNFTMDARIAFAQAITDAEERNPAILRILRWRAGVTSVVSLSLETLGTYSSSAPYACPKSSAILEKGLQYMMNTNASDGNWAYSALTLLAANNPANPNNSSRQAKASNEFRSLILTPELIAQYMSGKSMSVDGKPWHIGPKLIALSEYYLHSGDPDVLPSIRAYAHCVANGQSMFGTCGHYFTNPGFRNAPVNGPYNVGYGPVNNAALPCYIGLVLANKCGLTDPEILAGIERAGTFYAQYTHLGCAGYGEHLPYEGHDTNGKAGLQALAFQLEGDRLESTRYYARASTAAAIAERDIGHTGSFFAFLYAPLGANVGGPDAIAYYFRETKWMYELARRWDGSFVYNSYSSGFVEVDALAGPGGCLMASPMLMTYALPLRQTYMTGKNQNPANWISPAEMPEVSAASAHIYNAPARTTNELLADLANWSPKVRRYAARELKLRTTEYATILASLHATASNESATRQARAGACAAMGEIADSSSVPVLLPLVTHPDFVVRFSASLGLSSMRWTNAAALKPHVNAIMQACITNQRPLLPLDTQDPMQTVNGNLCIALFAPHAALFTHDLVGVDRNLLYGAIRACAANAQAEVRNGLYTIYPKLTQADILQVADALVDISFENAQAGMGTTGAREPAIAFLESNSRAEGVPLAIRFAEDLGYDNGGIVDPLNVLTDYAGSSNTVTPNPDVGHFCEVLISNGAKYGIPEAQATLQAIASDPNPPVLAPFKRIDWVFPDDPALNLPKNWTTLRVFSRNFSHSSSVYSWKKLRGAGAVTFSPNGSAAAKNTTVVFDGTPGQYLFEVKMTDPHGLTEVTRTVSVTLRDASGTLPPNSPPVADTQSLVAVQGTPTQIILTGADPEGFPLRYAVTGGPAKGTVTGAAPYLVYTPAANSSGSDSITFLVEDSEGQTATATVNLTLGAAGPVGLAIYEPFNYPAGNLQGRSGTSEVGLAGTWTAGSQITTESPTLGFGNLPASGNRARSVAVNQPGASRPISTAALAGRGLLDNGSTVWFSVVMGGYGGWINGSNVIDLALANNGFPNGSTIPNDGSVPGSGLGVRLSNKGLYASQYAASGAPLTGPYDNSVNGGIVNDTTRLVVGRITWGATSDTVEIYLPDQDMTLSSQPVSTLTANVNQATFDTLTFSRGANVLIDEIRFGATLQSVLQGTVAMSPDVTAPSPDPMSFDVVPTPASSNSITMTATPALDGMGVEYLFTCTAGGGNSSGWQNSHVYTDTGLTPGVPYSYTVRARDKHPGLNQTAASAPATATIPTHGTVPAVVGLVQSLAENRITQAALSTGTVSVSSSFSLAVPAGHVLSQSPAAGSSAAYGSPVHLVISIGQDPALPVLAPVQIVDQRNGETVELGTSVTYTLTFSKDIDATTLDAGDFRNAGDAPIAIGGIAETSPGVVLVTITPNGSSSGSLRLAIAAGALIQDTSGNALNTSFAIMDDTVIAVVPIQPKTQIFTGINSTNTDNWNTASNWNTNSGPVPSGTDNVVIPNGKLVTVNSSATPVYAGNLTLGVGSLLHAGYNLNHVNVNNCLGTAGSTTITLSEGSGIAFRENFSPIIPAIILQGNAGLTTGSSTSPGSHPVFNYPISGPYAFSLSGKTGNTSNLNAANNFGHLILSPSNGSLFNVNANTAGALGGDVTVHADANTGGRGANLVFNAANAMSDTSTLTLYGNSGTLVTVHYNDTIGELRLNGVKQLPGSYHSGNSPWISGTGTLTVSGAAIAYWNPIAGPSGTWDDSNIWNTQVNLAGSNNAWSAGQIAAFPASGTYGVALDGAKEIGGLVVTNGSVTLSGGELILGSDAPVSVASGSSLSLGTVVSQNLAGLGLHKSGAGSLVLSSENTFTGPVTIGAGVLAIATIDNAGAPSALGQFPDPGIGGLYLAGGTLRYTGGSTTVNRGFTFTGNSGIDITNSGTALTLGPVETAGPGTLSVTGGSGASLNLGNLKIVQGNNLVLSPSQITMNVASVEGYSAYPINAVITLAGSSTGNVVAGNIYASAYPGSTYQQGIGLVKNGSGDWRIAGAMTAAPAANVNVTVNDGTLTLAGNNTFAGFTLVNNRGKLVLDFAATNTSKLASAELRLAGGTLELKGGSHVEVVGSVTVNAGPTAFITRNGGTAKLRMNAINRNSQGTISFLDGTVADTDRININGILGGYATLGGDWAVNSTNGADGPVAALSAYDAWTGAGGSPTANYQLNGTATLAGTLAANSLKIVNTDVNQGLNLGAHSIQVTSTSSTTLGGVLYAGGANGKYTVSGTGALLASTTTGELIVHTSAGELTVNSPMVTSGATAGVLTKSGPGSLVLGGSNVYTGTTRVNGGKLFVHGSLSNQNANLHVDPGATLGGSGTVGRNITIADGARLEFTLGSSAGSHIPLTRGSGRTFSFSGSSVLTIQAGPNAAPGLYTLITGGSNIAGAAPATVILPPGWTADAPTISGAQLRINITSVVAPPANQTPVWTSNPVQEPNATEDAPYGASLVQDASDANNDVLTFVKVAGPAWLNIHTNGTLSGTPTNSDVGSNSFTVSVSDGIAAPVQATVNLTVLNTNDAPVWSANPLVAPSATEDSAYSAGIALAAADVDVGAALSFSKISGPAWLGIASNGSLSGTPSNADVGLNVFSVSVSDGIAAPVQVTLHITVLNTNDIPFWNVHPISGGNIVRDLPYTGTLAGNAADVDPAASLTFSKISGPAWLSVAADGTLSGTPAASDVGVNNFSVGVSDGIAATVPATLQIHVINANVAPVAQSQSVSTDEDAALPVTLAGSDADNNPLTYTIVSPPIKGTLGGTAPNLTYTPSANQNGGDSFTFKVNDAVEDSNIATVSVAIQPLNDAPVFAANPIVLAAATETVAYTGQSLSGRATDVDAGDSLTYSKISGPSWLSVAANGTISGTPPVGTAGVNSFVVRATDSASAIVDATLQIPVNLYALTWDANTFASGQTNGAGAWFGNNLWWDSVLGLNINWVNGSHAIFGGQASAGGAVTLAGPATVNSLTFNAFTGTYTIGSPGQTITLNSGIDKTASSGTATITSPVVLGANQAWTNQSAGSLTASSALDLGANTLAVGGTGTTSLTGVISGSGGLVKSGSGRLLFHSGNANTYTGTTTIQGGSLMMANIAASLGAGNVTLNGGVLEAYWGLALTRSLGAGSGQIQLTGGASGFGQNGGGQNFTINFGNNAANEAVWGSASFDPSILAFHSSSSGAAANVTLANHLDLNGATRTVDVHGGSAGTASANLSGVIRSSSGTAGLIKTGAGLLMLTGNNTFTGPVTLSNGILRVGNGGTGTLGNGSYAGNISIGGSSTLQLWSSSAQTLGGVISGAGTLHKAHGGTLTLSGPNTYSGRTSFQPQNSTGFTVNISSFNSVNGGTPSMPASSLGAPTTIANGTIDIGNSSQTAGVNLTYTGPGETTDRVLLFGFSGNATHTLTASGSGLLKFASAMSSNAITTQNGSLALAGTGLGEITQILPSLPSGGVVKSGTGTWILGGPNTYTGPTVITAGKLFIHGNQSSASGTISVSAGATLGGTGTLGGNTSIAATGRLEFQIGTPSASHDKLDLASGRSLAFAGSSVLTIASSGGASPGIYTLLSAPGGITGAAPSTLNLPNGWVATVSIAGNDLLLHLTSVGGTVPGSLNLAESGGLSASGFVGGPFSPGSMTYTLSNPGQAAISWSAAKTTPWVTLSAASGTLNGGASTMVTVSLNANANAMAAGTYADTVSFANTTNGSGDTTRAVTLTALTRPTYLVSYDGNGSTGGSVPPNQIKNQGVAIVLSGPSSLARTGHSFSQWNTSPDGSGTSHAAGSAYSSDASTVLYAQWVPDTYTVTFDPNGGSTPIPASKAVSYGSIYGGLSSVSRSGHTFAGWFDAPSGGSEITSTTSVSITSAQTLYARWTANTYTVTLDPNGGDVPVPASILATYDHTYGPLPAPVRTGHTFIGWFTATSGGSPITSGTTVAITAEQTLHAQWTANSYTVTLDANNGNTPAPSNIQAVYDSTYGPLPAATRSGHTFNGWFTAPSGGSEVTSSTAVAITADQTLYAQWTADSYTVTLDANGGDVPLPDNTLVTYGAAYGALPAATRTGHTFNGWFTSPTGGSEVTSSTTVAITSAQTLFARWTVNSYTVTLDANGGATSVPSSVVVTYNASYGTLPVPARTGHTFSGWFSAPVGGVQVTASTTVTILTDQTLYARWSANTYSVSFDANAGAPVPSGISVTYGAPYGTLAGVTRSGYLFQGWFTAAVGGTLVTSTSSVTIAENHILYAQWLLILPEIDVTLGGQPVSSTGYHAVNNSIAGTAATLAFTIANTGSDPLALGIASKSGESNCAVTIQTPPSSTVAPSASTSLVLSITPATVGAWSFSVSLPSNDADENPYIWTVHGVAQQTTTSSFVASADTYLNGASPGTNYGSATTLALNRRSNQNRRGLINFDLSSIPAGSTVSSATMQFVAAGGQTGSVEIYDTLGVWNASTATSSNSSSVIGNTLYGSSPIDTAALGTSVPDITLNAAARTLIEGWISSTSAKNGFSIKTSYNTNSSNSVTVCSANHATASYRPKLTVTHSHLPLAPEIHVTRSGSLVADEGTDSVSGTVAGTGMQVSYAIANLGNSNLTLGTPVSLVAGSNCTAVVHQQPAATIAASSTSQAMITITPTNQGSWSATLSIANNDPNEAPYNWTINGTATATYTLTYSAGPGGTLNGLANQIVNHGGNGTPVTALPNAGYVFADWSDGVLTPSRTETSVTAHRSVTARFVLNPYASWTTGTFAQAFTDTSSSSNPDGDSMDNRMEFAFGTDPTSPVSGPLAYLPGGDVLSTGSPIVRNFAATGQPADYRAVFLRRKGHSQAGLVYTVRFSADLKLWTSSVEEPSLQTSPDSPGPMEVVSVSYPSSVPLQSGGNAAPKFFRLDVSGN